MSNLCGISIIRFANYRGLDDVRKVRWCIPAVLQWFFCLLWYLRNGSRLEWQSFRIVGGIAGVLYWCIMLRNITVVCFICRIDCGVFILFLLHYFGDVFDKPTRTGRYVAINAQKKGRILKFRIVAEWLLLATLTFRHDASGIRLVHFWMVSVCVARACSFSFCSACRWSRSRYTKRCQWLCSVVLRHLRFLFRLTARSRFGSDHPIDSSVEQIMF